MNTARARTLALGLVGITVAMFGMVPVARAAPPTLSDTKSSPPDTTRYSRPAEAAARFATAQPVSGAVFTTDPSLSSSSAGGSEPSIAVNPSNPDQIAITRFTFLWNSNADLLHSTDGGATWTNRATIPAPPGVPGTSGCPCDQTIDYGRDGRLYGTFLASGGGGTRVVTGSTTDPTLASAWSWNGNPAQLTSGTRTGADQPWLLVNRDPTTAAQDNAYVAYDDFGAGPDARVAVSYGANPVNITTDQKAGTESPLATNPGLRMASDPRNGTMYVLYEQSTGATQPKSVTYRLNRSTDGGATWTLNGNADGLVVDTVNSDQAPGFKFGTVNALLGGVDHPAVDPSNGDVYVVYGQDVAGGNQIRIRRLQDNGVGGLSVGPASNVSTSTNAALPSVAVLTDGTIGVLYDTFDGTSGTGFPLFSAHLARSSNHGSSFNDVVLQSFASPATDNGNARQRVFGDYQQMKAVGATFFGVFSGNANGFGSATSQVDPIFFKVTQEAPPCTTTLSGDVLGPVTVNAGASTCLDNARVVGPVTVNPGGAVNMTGSQVTKGVVTNGAIFVKICATKVSAGLSVTNSTGPVIVGDTAAGCAGNQISAPGVNVASNVAGTVLGGNTSAASMSVNNNTGGINVVKANTVNVNLNCAGNVPAPVNAGQPNTVFGSKTGQCAAL
jgi:hypothetical protein